MLYVIPMLVQACSLNRNILVQSRTIEPAKEEIKKIFIKSRESDKLADGIGTDGLDNVISADDEGDEDDK